MMNKKQIKVLMIVETVVSLSMAVISALFGEGDRVILWLVIWAYQMMWCMQENEVIFWRDMARESARIADETMNLHEKLMGEHKRALDALKDCYAAVEEMDPENALAEYIRAKAKLCDGTHCAGCPLKEAGMQLSDEEISADGLQMMEWCDLYEYLRPVESARLVMKWAEENNGNP